MSLWSLLAGWNNQVQPSHLDTNGTLSHLDVSNSLRDVVPLWLSSGDQVALPELHGLVNKDTNATTAACKVGRWLKSRSLLFTHAMFFVAPQAPKDSTGNSMENCRDVFFSRVRKHKRHRHRPPWHAGRATYRWWWPRHPWRHSPWWICTGRTNGRDKKQTASLLHGAWGHHSRHGALPNHQSAWSGGTHTEPWGAALVQFLLQKCMKKYEFIQV